MYIGNIICCSYLAFASSGRIAEHQAPTEVTKLTSPTPLSGFVSFGSATAIGDGTWVIGDPGDSEFEDESGAVFVFQTTTTAQSAPLFAKIAPHDATPFLGFGRGLSASADRIAVTSDLRTYIFRIRNGQWIHEISVPNQSFSVSIGAHEVAIGGSLLGGSVVTYRLDPGLDATDTADDTWVENSWLTGSSADESFGFSVVLDDNRLVVGAPRGKVNGTRTGVAYVFEHDSVADGWVQTARLEPTGATSGAEFGHCVATRADMVVVGAPRNHPSGGGTGRGAAYAYAKNALSGSWTNVGRLAAKGHEDDLFGFSVAIGEKTVFVGAYLAETAGDQTGTAYQFKLRRNGHNMPAWHLVNKFAATDTEKGDGFGWSMVHRDGTLLVGAIGANPDGAAYVFEAN